MVLDFQNTRAENKKFERTHEPTLYALFNLVRNHVCSLNYVLSLTLFLEGSKVSDFGVYAATMTFSIFRETFFVFKACHWHIQVFLAGTGTTKV